MIAIFLKFFTFNVFFIYSIIFYFINLLNMAIWKPEETPTTIDEIRWYSWNTFA